MSHVDNSLEVQRAEDMNLYINQMDAMCEQTGTTWSQRMEKLAEGLQSAASLLEEGSELLHQERIDKLSEIARKLKDAEETGEGLHLQKVAAAEVVIKIRKGE